MTKTLWLSFSDPHRPAGERFLGVVVMDVTEEDARIARPHMLRERPKAKAGAEWLWVAMQRAWALGINPGGAIQFQELVGERAAALPRNRLLLKPELEDLRRQGRI